MVIRVSVSYSFSWIFTPSYLLVINPERKSELYDERISPQEIKSVSISDKKIIIRKLKLSRSR